MHATGAADWSRLVALERSSMPGAVGAETPPGVTESIKGALDIESTRNRARTQLGGRERWATGLVAGAFVLAAVAMAIVGVGSFSPPGWIIAALVVAYAVATRIEFELGPGSVVPTEAILVPIVFLAPPLAPLCVAAGMLLGGLAEVARGAARVDRWLALLVSCWHSVGPAFVIWTLAPGTPRLSAWPVYLLALASQFAFDLGSNAVRHALGRSVALRDLLEPFAWVFLIDTFLAPIGLLAALDAAADPARTLLVLPVVGLLGVVANDRRRHVNRSIELGRAYANASVEARTDSLTGVGNRLAWKEALIAATAEPQPVTVALVDVDELKAANDEHGHVFGDRLLRAAARAVLSAVNSSDVVARIGGDEFAVLAPGLDEQGCAELVARIRNAVASHPAIDGVRLAVSVGGASTPAARLLTDALLAADAELYAQKAYAQQ